VFEEWSVMLDENGALSSFHQVALRSFSSCIPQSPHSRPPYHFRVHTGRPLPRATPAGVTPPRRPRPP
jgi:hypothetical protein